MPSPRRLLDLAAAFVLLWPLAGYPLTLSLLARLQPKRARRPLPAMLPVLTVILPTYQEAANVVPRLENLAASDYPRERLEVVVVDSGSTDGTANAVEAYRCHTEMRLVLVRERERAGKAAAINRALGVAAGEIAVVTDAPARFERGALREIAACFADPQVGAATGYFEVTGAPGMVQRAEAQFWRVRNVLRGLEARVDSTPFLSGELCAFRRTLVRLDEDTLADDMNVALQVRRQGYRVAVCDTARASEPRSNSLRELMDTKSRRAAGGVQELMRNRDMAGDARYGWFGRLILPSAMLYYLPLRLPALALLAASALRAFGAASLPVRALVALSGAAVALAGGRRLVEQAGMLAFNEWIFLQGWRRYLTRRMDVRWRQERSTRGEAVEKRARR